MKDTENKKIYIYAFCTTYKHVRNKYFFGWYVQIMS